MEAAGRVEGGADADAEADGGSVWVAGGVLYAAGGLKRRLYEDALHVLDLKKALTCACSENEPGMSHGKLGETAVGWEAALAWTAGHRESERRWR